MPDANVSTSALTILERITGAIRRELGSSIDAYPGCHSPEAADPMNRGFRAVVRALRRGGRWSRGESRGDRLPGPPPACRAAIGDRGLG
jgi:hypothetical protein